MKPSTRKAKPLRIKREKPRDRGQLKARLRNLERRLDDREQYGEIVDATLDAMFDREVLP